MTNISTNRDENNTMSHFNPVNPIIKTEDVDFIVPERIREACIAKSLSYAEAAERCNISPSDFGLMANGHKPIPKELIFNLQRGLEFPSGFFFKVRWERV